MPTLTVRHLEVDLVRRLRIRAAEHGRSAEAEHREILRVALMDPTTMPDRREAAERLAAFRARTAGRNGASTAELLDETRTRRVQTLLDRADAP